MEKVMNNKKVYEAGERIVKCEGERKFGVILPIIEGEEQSVRWSDGSITSVTRYRIARNHDHIS